MTGSLPPDVQSTFERFITTELTTIDRRGQPITWPVTPYYRTGAPCIDVTTGLGYPKKAKDAQANPLVALLFSDPTGSGLQAAPMVLVQGSAQVDDRDLDANRERYARESREKLPATAKLQPPETIKRYLSWYFTRIYIHIRPGRVDGAARWIRIEGEPTGIPFQPGLACLTAHEHAEDMTWQENFQVRGDLVQLKDAWALIPRKLVGGFELPSSRMAMLRSNLAKARRFRRTAKQELARRS